LYGIDVNSEKNTYETPKVGNFGKSEISLAFLLKTFKIKIDACAKNERVAMIKPPQGKFFTPEIDGLKQEWNENTIINPPFNEIPTWLSYGLEQVDKHKITLVAILPAYTDASWFFDYVWDILPKSQIWPIIGRLNYWENNEPAGSPPFASLIAYWSQEK